ncbi:MAG: AraC family ligand binding domain-containing protein, partial [Clostridia bacterium]|nr:AraC family ligand binding domain-containing protein [Clostridia bacterium]
MTLNYTPAVLKDDFPVKKLYSVHYFEYSTNYRFEGEKHPFWEMIYVDKGSALITAGEREFTLTQGRAYFHKPDEWHDVRSNETAPGVAVISFECISPAMEFFKDKTLAVGQKQKELISKIIAEFINGFETPLNVVFCDRPQRRKAQLLGAEQLIKCYISELLISFVRESAPVKQYSAISKNEHDARLTVILSYMENHLGEKVTGADLQKCSSLNKSTVNRLFREAFSASPAAYFIKLKTERAKELLRK